MWGKLLFMISHLLCGDTKQLAELLGSWLFFCFPIKVYLSQAAGVMLFRHPANSNGFISQINSSKVQSLRYLIVSGENGPIQLFCHLKTV